MHGQRRDVRGKHDSWAKSSVTVANQVPAYAVLPASPQKAGLHESCDLVSASKLPTRCKISIITNWLFAPHVVLACRRPLTEYIRKEPSISM